MEYRTHKIIINDEMEMFLKKERKESQVWIPAVIIIFKFPVPKHLSLHPSLRPIKPLYLKENKLKSQRAECSF